MSAHVGVEAQTSRKRVEAAEERAVASEEVVRLKRRTMSLSYLVLKCAGVLDLDVLVQSALTSGLDGLKMASIESWSHVNCGSMPPER